MSKPLLHLDVVVDVVCPWCFLGKRRLDAAIAGLDTVDFAVAYRPFQLDPAIPKGGLPREAYMLSKFKDRKAIDEVHVRLADMGRDVGIAFDFEAIETAPNTLDAHRLIRWAGQQGRADAMVERLFALYFEEGADLTRADTLIEAAETVGLDEDDVAMKLDGNDDLDVVKAEIVHASSMGITGVPCIIVERKFAISGAQSTEILIEAFSRISAELEAARA